MTAKLLHELVHEAARAHGNKTAVAFDSSIAAGVCLTYNEVISLANELTGHLRIYVQKHHGTIGLFCHADVLLPAWIVGILQFPAAYVPLDPASPPLCNLRMINKCRLNYCLLQNELLNQFQSAFSNLLSLEICVTLSSHRLTLIKIQSEQDTNIKMSDQRSSSAMTKDIQQSEPLAYVLHTSGTTGLPKIVKVPHRCIVPNITHLRSVFKMTAEDVVLLSSPLTFDPSVVEVFLALSSGACLLIVPSAVKKMPRRLANVLFKRNKTTVLQATPTLVRRFGRRILQEEVLSANSPLRLLAFGGEPCPSLSLLKSWRQEGNGTHICNLYGTTEVSCWASCYKVPDKHLCSEDITDQFVPLGEPMLDTVMEVRDETGRLVAEGEGQLFIGGQERVCLLDDEETVVEGTMRATGDWVQVRDSQLYFLGRKDRLIKRFGQRVHLDALQQVGDKCVITVHVSRNSTSPSLRVTEGEIRQRLSQLLASHSIPDMIFFIPALPLTSHGKIAIDELMRMCDAQKQDINTQTVWKDIESVRLKLQTLWKECLGLPNDVAVEEDAHFMLSGGDSLQALRLCDEITVAMGTPSVGLLEVILDGSFSDVVSHVMTETHNNAIQPSKKRMLDDSGSLVSPKRQQKEMSTGNATESTVGFVVPSVRRTMGFVVVRRAGEVIDWGCFGKMQENNFKLTVTSTSEDSLISNPSRELHNIYQENPAIKKLTEPHVPQEVTETLPVSKSPGEGSWEDRSDVLLLGLRVLWSSDTGRCVDASPVLLVGPDRTTVFIGSHSHRLQALDLTSGEVIWERILGDRLESSAAISKCGSLVAVVYMSSTFLTCKSCLKANVYLVVLHELSVQDSGKLLWTYPSSVPFFSSPRCSDSSVFIGSVNGQIIGISHTGDTLWEFSTNGPIFSSPCISSLTFWTNQQVSTTPNRSTSTLSNHTVTCGSHDGHVYCINGDNGSLLWQFQTTGKVFSTPFVFDGDPWGLRTLVAVCSTDGKVWILDAETGTLKATLSLPGELFSSPVVWGHKIVVGCRNDYVYCLELTKQ
uniref:Beta-alanine-activating enzyme n=1 Tax=Cyprinus carpio TaxID=7962 RepID=A0A8C1YGA1_CYPCA